MSFIEGCFAHEENKWHLALAWIFERKTCIITSLVFCRGILVLDSPLMHCNIFLCYRIVWKKS
jgi:hypothetical protein